VVRPEKKFKIGCCEVAVWANQVQTADGPKILRRVGLQRVFKDQSGFHNTQSLRQTDIPKAMLALQQAYKYLTSADSKPQQPINEEHPEASESSIQ